MTARKVCVYFVVWTLTTFAFLVVFFVVFFSKQGKGLKLAVVLIFRTFARSEIVWLTTEYKFEIIIGFRDCDRCCLHWVLTVQ